MEYVKRISLTSILIISLIVFADCISKGDASSSSNDKVDREAWVKEHILDGIETVDELYEKAKEEGSVIIYAKSSRFQQGLI